MKKFTLRVSGARPGSDVRPGDASIVKPMLAQPRFGLRVHSSPLAPKPTPLTADDYATADDYELKGEPVPLGCK